jgi:hypothetical protein
VESIPTTGKNVVFFTYYYSTLPWLQIIQTKQWHGPLLYNCRFSLVQTVKEEKAKVCYVNKLNAPWGAGHQ